MKKQILCLVVVVLAVSVGINSSYAAYVDYLGAGHWDSGTMNVVASQTYHPNYSPNKTVNGAGLDASGLLHSNEASLVTWLRSGLGTAHPASPAGTVAWLEYHFDGYYELGSMWVWNYCYPDNGGRGVKAASILYSETGASNPADWTTAWTGDFNKSTGVNNYAHETEITFNSPITAQYVLIAIYNNWDNSDLIGLGEVRFNIVPEPFSLLLLAAGGLTLIRKRLQ